ncbi:hypothetical protein COO20_17985 [Thalassospira marina]|uniref:Uncharacterized protein n=1 Tax=Thalassospira marina TaxID=2048283 RepID=A0A2N3KN71_9PROT|nr:hypothetical protein COO20_17985 [Thalassospira marina]
MPVSGNAISSRQQTLAQALNQPFSHPGAFAPDYSAYPRKIPCNRINHRTLFFASLYCRA